MNKKIPDWVIEHNRKIQDFEARFFKIPQGETEVEVDMDFPPERREGTYGIQYVYTVTIDEERFLLGASGRLDKLITAALMQGLNPFTVERDGEGKDTRYAIKGLDLHRKREDAV
jgi:hypothetical protein